MTIPFADLSSQSRYQTRTRVVTLLRRFFDRLVRQGGPEPADYAAVNSAVLELACLHRIGLLTAAEVDGLLDTGSSSVPPRQTMQDFARTKPHGYPGDFEFIDRIYEQWISPDPAVAKWDHFFHAQAAARALRNQKRHFLSWLGEMEAKHEDVLPSLHLLHLGGGPGRDVREYLHAAPHSRIYCSFVDMDARALAHARRLNPGARGRLSFHQANPLGFRTAIAPHLIWVAGLSDYLDDTNCSALLHRLWRLLAPGGELALANFSPGNPTRNYMELSGWRLNYRDSIQLADMAREAGVPEACISVWSEPEQVIHVLHVEKPATDPV